MRADGSRRLPLNVAIKQPLAGRRQGIASWYHIPDKQLPDPDDHDKTYFRLSRHRASE
jgi:hypothetical protein